MDDYVVVGIAALVLVILFAFVWPGAALVHASKIEGFWRVDATNTLLTIREGPSGKTIEVQGAAHLRMSGNLMGFNRIRINVPGLYGGRTGTFRSNFRIIEWDSGGTWTLQGI